MRLSMLAALTLLLALPACKSGEDGMAVTGVCLYPAQGPLVATCVNLWDGDTNCQDLSEQAGTYEASGGCGEWGYDQPCIYDYPWTLWISSEGDQHSQEAACDARMSEEVDE